MPYSLTKPQRKVILRTLKDRTDYLPTEGTGAWRLGDLIERYEATVVNQERQVKFLERALEMIQTTARHVVDASTARTADEQPQEVGSQEAQAGDDPTHDGG